MVPKYPQVEVQLVGMDGNVFNLMGLVSNALKKAARDPDSGVPNEAATALVNRVMSEAEDYDHALRILMETVTVY